MIIINGMKWMHTICDCTNILEACINSNTLLKYTSFVSWNLSRLRKFFQTAFSHGIYYFVQCPKCNIDANMKYSYGRRYWSIHVQRNADYSQFPRIQTMSFF